MVKLRVTVMVCLLIATALFGFLVFDSDNTRVSAGAALPGGPIYVGPGGDYATLIKTLKEKFSTMTVSTRVYPGHGEITDIGFEKAHNQFLLNA